MSDSSVDLSSIWKTSQTAPVLPPSPSFTGNTDLRGIWGAPSSPEAASASPAQSEPNDLSSIWGKGKPRPLAGQTPTPPTSDPDEGFLHKAWDWANTPLTESLFGLPSERQGAGGFERGVEHIAAGLTSPLSLLLTAATFGTGGILESAGTTALKEAVLDGEAAFSAADIAQITKGSQAAIDAWKAMKPIEPVINDALMAKGGEPLLKLVDEAKAALGPIDKSAEFGEEHVQDFLSKKLKSDGTPFTAADLKQLSGASKVVQDATENFTPIRDAVKEAVGEEGADVWKRGQDFLYKNGLTEHDLLAGNLVQRGAFQILRKTLPDIPVAATVRAAKTANTLLNAGFAYQQLEMASQMSPRFFDALKEGDYDHAWEYGTEAAAGGLLGTAGLGHFIPAIGELTKPLIQEGKFRPNDEWLAIDRANKAREADHAVAEQHAVGILRDAYQKLGYDPNRPFLGLSKEQLAKQEADMYDTVNGMVTSSGATDPKAVYNVLARILGKPGFGEESPLTGQQARFDPDAAHSLENTVQSLVPKPLRDVSTDDIAKAGGSQELQDQWDEYQNRPQPSLLSHEELNPLIRAQVTPRQGQAGAVVSLNNYAHDAIARAMSEASGKALDRGWRGFRVDAHGAQTIANALDRMAEQPGRENYGVLADRIRTAAENSKDNSAILLKRDVHVLKTLSHEHVHGWQERNPLTPEQMEGVIQTPEYKAALKTFENRGYHPQADSTPLEVLSHFAEGDQLGLGPTRALALAKSVLKLYTAKQLQSFPSSDPLIIRALKELGYDSGINRRAGAGVSEQATRVFRVGPEGPQIRGQKAGPEGTGSSSTAEGVEPSEQASTAAKLAESERNRGVLGGSREGGRRTSEVGVSSEGNNRGDDLGRGRGNPKTGLQARELPPKEQEEFDKLSQLSLRVGMGDLRSAGLVTGDNRVFIGARHDDLALKAGYKPTATANVYTPFFRDGGVRVRSAGGTVHIDFAKSDPATVDRVYQSIISSPDAGKYIVDFRPFGDAPGFNTSAYSKDDVLYKLKDWEDGRAKNVPVNSVAYFRQPGPVNGLMARERENLAPVWYLKSNQLIDSRMQGPMPAETVLKMLENNGVKPDELKYTGLSDFLREKGKAPVRPEEIKSYLAANNLQVQEVTKGESRHLSSLLEQQEAFRQSFERGEISENELSRHLKPLYDEIDGIQMGEGYGQPPKFGSYVLPGGDNYRELLMTLPEGGPKIDLRKAMDQAYENKEWFMADIRRRTGRFLHETLTPEQKEEWRRLDDAYLQAQDDYSAGGSNNFRSSHWDEPNVVGHVRFNDRTGPNGEKLLHLEELQSDWHQKGRTQGYRGSVEEYPADFVDKYRPEMMERLGPDAPRPTDQQVIDFFGLRSQNENAVPDAPFKKTWPELLFKRMVRYAAEHGYDGISWTPGEEQAARYDLSKLVDAIHYRPAGPDRFAVEAYRQGEGTVLSKLGSPEELEGVVGKDIVKKMVFGEGEEVGGPSKYKRLTGVDLKVGGEGMKGFYDKMVPEMANKLGKQYGAKVGETKIYSGTTALDRGYNIHRPGAAESYAGPFDSAEEASKHKESAKDEIRQAGSKSVPYFPITDSLRDSVLSQGQPLFARERPVNGLPEDIEDLVRRNKFKSMTPEYQNKQLESWGRLARGEVSPQVKDATDYLRNEDGLNYEIANANDLIHAKIEDHMTRYYKDTNPQGKVLVADAKSNRNGFATNVTMARRQVYGSHVTALLMSPKEIQMDPVNAVARGRAEIMKAAANRQFIKSMRDSFMRGSDGRPAVVLSGSGRVVTGPNGEDPRTLIYPGRINKLNVPDEVVQSLQKSGDLARFLDDGTLKDLTPKVHPDSLDAAIDRLSGDVKRLKDPQRLADVQDKLDKLQAAKKLTGAPQRAALDAYNDGLKNLYVWDPQDYITLDNKAMRGWNFVTNDPTGNHVLVDADIRVHPEFAEYLKNRLGLEPSVIAKTAVGRAILGAGSKLKQTLLSLSPFHAVQIMLRGIMTGVNPLTLHGPDIIDGAKVDPSDPNSPTKIYAMVRQGLTTGVDYHALQEGTQGASEGVAANGDILRRIPGIGPVIAQSLDSWNSLLFKRLIPAVKMTAAEHMFDEYQRLHPEWSIDRVAKAAGEHANRSFGGINFKALGVSATTVDTLRAISLAPDWLVSEMSSAAHLFNKEEGGLTRAQVIKMSLAMWGLARVLNLVTTGNAHYEAPFSLAVKNKEGKETMYGVRTLPGDILHMISDPVNFVKGRMSPVLRAATEVGTGRDLFQRKLSPQDLWVDVFRQMAPIPLQAAGQAVTGTGPEIGNTGQFVKALGGTAQVYQTPAQKTAAEFAANHNEDGPIDVSQMARHRMVMTLEDRVRSGQVSYPELMKLTYGTDQLRESELKKITDNVKKTQGMDASMASLYTRASRLPAKELLSVWDTCNPAEKAALAPLMVQAQRRYLNKAKKDLTPEERQRDPVFQRLMQMIPRQPGSPQ